MNRRETADAAPHPPIRSGLFEIRSGLFEIRSGLFEITASDVAMTNDEWYTPRWIFDAAGLTFDLDVCAPVTPEFRTCPARRYLTVLDDGLVAPWDGLVWMNPPYSNSGPWVERFIRHSAGLALVPAANSSWRGPLMLAADGIALVSVSTKLARPSIGSRTSSGFGRPDGTQVGYPVALILAARGELAVSALEAVAMTDPYAGGAWHVRPGLEQIPEPSPAAPGTLL